MEVLPPSEDGSIQRLLDEGYALYRRGPYLVMSVPYLDAAGDPHTGYMVDTINFDHNGQARTLPMNHQMYFIGGQPYDQEGRILFSGNGANVTPLFDGKLSSFYWSWKQHGDGGVMRDYVSLHEKFTEYACYISGPAEAKHPEFQATPFANLGEADEDCPFPFDDMNSARANLSELDKLLASDTIAIIGAGGTGSYIFDLVSKTRVKEIRLFDFDVFDLHNAFRVPGATHREELGQPKVRVIEQRYAGWHKRAKVIEAKLDQGSMQLLEGVTFAFLAVDKMGARREIAKMLLAHGIPVIIVGMGLHHGNPGLTGMVDTTLLDPSSSDDLINEVIGEDLVDIPDEYQKNIQTVELNALNAAMAVFMYKRYRGYYASGRAVSQATFTISTMQLDRE
ncbi:DUF6791 domain-containing protein [Tsuneonella rigui]|uniref:DUF6791 domain-containing protein n=1 Tax=Tsuneonella rigui TaxID=1708790 RepID=UPI000F7EE3C5|nr:DUF6791 domain-containing protein [Tsuneonella rigui]